MIGEQANGRRELSFTETQIFGAPGAWVRDADIDRGLAHFGNDADEIIGDVWEGLVASLVLGAAGENVVDGPLAFRCDLGAKGQLRWYNAVNNHRSSRVGVTAGEMLRNARPVGHAVQIQFLIAKRLAYGLEISDGHAGRKETRVVRQLVETELGVFDREFR